jgi:hypothetical protein
MRPGHIRVFDGLRMTTEHVNHLQGAMHSALQEIREILGLGRVYLGFEVSAEVVDQITVLPGLAFDYQGNRLACDEPKILPLSFAPGEEAKYVCLKYDQVEDGQVEGQFTMIWDSCSVLLRSDPPGPNENLLPIAIISNNPQVTGENKLKIVSLVEDQPGKGSTLSEVETEAVPDAPPEAPAPNPVGADVVAATPSSSEEEQAEAPASVTYEAGGYEAGRWRLQVRQGVARLATDSGAGSSLRGIMLELLRKRMNGGEVELMFPLAERDVALDFCLSSLSYHTIINADFQIAGEHEANWKCQATADGEATIVDGVVSQFGVSMIQTQPMDSGYPRWSGSELRENGIAHLPFSAWQKGIEPTTGIFQQLQLLIKTETINDQNFKVMCGLHWKGSITEETIRDLEEQDTHVAWEVLAAWKALGVSQE